MAEVIERLIRAKGLFEFILVAPSPYINFLYYLFCFLFFLSLYSLFIKKGVNTPLYFVTLSIFLGIFQLMKIFFVTLPYFPEHHYFYYVLVLMAIALLLNFAIPYIKHDSDKVVVLVLLFIWSYITFFYIWFLSFGLIVFDAIGWTKITIYYVSSLFIMLYSLFFCIKHSKHSAINWLSLAISLLWICYFAIFFSLYLLLYILSAPSDVFISAFVLGVWLASVVFFYGIFFHEGTEFENVCHVGIAMLIFIFGPFIFVLKYMFFSILVRLMACSFLITVVLKLFDNAALKLFGNATHKHPVRARRKGKV